MAGEAIWAFLSEPGNRAILTWIGGGLAAAAGAAWTVLIYLRGSGPKKEAGPPSVLAGRDVTVTSGPSSLGPVLLGMAGLGLAILALALLGPRVSSTAGVAVGGDVKGSTIFIKGE